MPKYAIVHLREIHCTLYFYRPLSSVWLMSDFPALIELLSDPCSPQLMQAMSIFSVQARGPSTRKYAEKLAEDCRAFWENGRQMCEEYSLTGNPCKQRLHYVHGQEPPEGASSSYAENQDESGESGWKRRKSTSKKWVSSSRLANRPLFNVDFQNEKDFAHDPPRLGFNLCVGLQLWQASEQSPRSVRVGWGQLEVLLGMRDRMLSGPGSLRLPSLRGQDHQVCQSLFLSYGIFRWFYFGVSQVFFEKNLNIILMPLQITTFHVITKRSSVIHIPQKYFHRQLLS